MTRSGKISLVFIVLTMLVAIFIPTIIVAEDNYVFTEAQLREYTTEVVDDAFNKKDFEIAILIMDHDLLILDKDFIITKNKLELESKSDLILFLNTKVNSQARWLKWSPVIIASTFVVGVITGLITAGKL